MYLLYGEWMFYNVCMEVLGLINYGDFFLDIWFFKIDWKCVSVYLIDFY